MLSRKNTLQNLYAENDDKGATPPPDTQQDKNENKGGAKTYTQEEFQAELNRVAAKEKRDGKEAAEKAMLGRLGVSSFDEAVAALEAKKQADEANKTEAQKLQDMIAQLTQERDAEKQRVAKIETERRIEKRDNELKSLLTQATDPNEVLALLKVFHAEKVEALLDANGVFDKAAAETLIADYRKDKGHLFRDNRLGSALSHKDGRNPEPNKETKEAAKTQTFRNMRNNA